MLYFVSVVYSFPSLNHIPLCGWTTFGWWTTLGCFYLVLLDSATVNVPVQAFVRADWCFRRPALGAVRGAQLGLEVRRRASCLASLSPSTSRGTLAASSHRKGQLQVEGIKNKSPSV